MRKLGTWWHPSSNVKIERWLTDDGEIIEKSIPISLDEWARTQSTHNTDVDLIKSHYSNSNIPHSTAYEQFIFEHCHIDKNPCYKRDSLGRRYCNSCERNSKVAVSLDGPMPEIPTRNETAVTRAVDRIEKRKCAWLQPTTAMIEESITIEEPVIKASKINNVDDNVSVWKSIWNFFFGWLKRK